LLSKPTLITLLVASGLVTSVAYYLNLSLIITELNAYLIYFISSALTMFSLYHLRNVKEPSYIYLTDDEVWFKEKDQNETICLKFEKLDYFETRFSEIVFCTKEEEKVVMQLNQIRDEKKRWEIKEFLRNHIKQIREVNSNHQLLASA
ncbi:hypothetical protein N9R54_06200, partial [Pelobium sp.]